MRAVYRGSAIVGHHRCDVGTNNPPQNCHLDRSMMVLSSCGVERPQHFARSSVAAMSKMLRSLHSGANYAPSVEMTKYRWDLKESNAHDSRNASRARPQPVFLNPALMPLIVAVIARSSS